MLRFSIRQLLIVTALLAVAFVALLNASPWWAAAMSSGVLLTLSAAIVLAIYREGQGRAFWIGFSVLGWVYLALLAASPMQGNYLDYPLGRNHLINEQIMVPIYNLAAYGYVIPPYPDPFAVPANADPFAVPSAPSPYSTPPRRIIAPLWRQPPPESQDFFNVGHALWSIGLATCGGWFAVWAFATRQRARGQV